MTTIERTTSTPGTRALVERYFDLINRGDWESWLSLFDEDAVMEDALSPRIQGIDALRATTVAIGQGFLLFRNEIVDLVVDDQKAMAVCRIEAVTAGGARIESVGANYYRLAGGRIAYMSSYHDTAPFNAAFAEGRPSPSTDPDSEENAT